MVDMSSVYNHLIGISFLKEQENSRVKEIWDKHFPATEAAFIQADLNETSGDVLAKLIQQVSVNKMGNLAGKSCNIAIFLDVQEKITPAQIEMISQISAKFQTAMFCTVYSEVQFAYIGTNPVSSDKFVDMKGSITAMSKACADNVVLLRRVCLIAQTMSVQDNEANNWKSVVVFLNLLRRNQTNDIIPTEGNKTNDDVVFLRYGDYDANRRDELQAEVQKLKDFLSNGGEQKLCSLINVELDKLKKEAMRAYPVDENKIKIHENMTVDGWFAKRRAKNGNNETFNNARAATKELVEKKGQALEAGIVQHYKDVMLADPDKKLQDLINKAPVGVNLLTDEQKMTAIFTGERPTAFIPPSPHLAYNENGYLSEIKQYLDNYQTYAICKAEKLVMQGLLEAYQRIDRKEYEDRIVTEKKHLQDAENALDAIPTDSVFLSDAEGAGVNLTASFYPVMPGGQSKRVIIEHDSHIAAEHQKKVGSGAMVAYIPKSQLIVQDTINTRALHILSFDCTNDRLDDLVKCI